MLIKCDNCEKDFLTEADSYLYIPTSQKFICFNCIKVQFGYKQGQEDARKEWRCKRCKSYFSNSGGYRCLDNFHPEFNWEPSAWGCTEFQQKGDCI